jgi:hypothetical protein
MYYRKKNPRAHPSAEELLIILWIIFFIIRKFLLPYTKVECPLYKETNLCLMA